jgi:ATP/maltotriose-dependent transcriptional regulator MalT
VDLNQHRQVPRGNIYRKLEAERRTQAVENARSLGLIA